MAWPLLRGGDEGVTGGLGRDRDWKEMGMVLERYTRQSFL